MTTSPSVFRNIQRLPAFKNRHARGLRALRGLGLLCGLLVLGDVTRPSLARQARPPPPSPPVRRPLSNQRNLACG